jgi:hypothetical protein
MTWKSTAVVSGAGLLSMWFAASPPLPARSPGAYAAQQVSPAAAATSSDIERQAARLQARLRREAEYREPARNLFRFRDRAAATPAPGIAPAPSAPEPVVAPPPPPPPIVTLSGIASDQVGDRTVRTAILSSPSGVLLVREGDDVLGQYRVAKITEDAVELTRVSDGTTLRVGLKP